ncbi:MAG TPA: SDR family oxidoreductase [Ohtaekwangia sp.]|uniref:SDR family oxidoreductase n=1 Tax=Ohtaekwangia sp. TaxID=2066019 RepID=UPI002F930D04
MKKTVLITGTSTGFGAATAYNFAEKGWNVIATMRDITMGKELSRLNNVLVTRLDVQDRKSIDAAITLAIEHFGKIDVLINNAGYGQFGIFESISREAILNQFEVNVFGVMDVIKAILPHFRSHKGGTIVNISSGAGAIGFPMASVYSASKFALEGLSEGLRYELASVGIKVKLIEPGGAMKTGFGTRMGSEIAALKPAEEYIPFLTRIGKLYGGMEGNSDPDAVEKVVAAIYDAALDNTHQLRYTPTNDIAPILKARRSTSEQAYQSFTDSLFLGE